jgi:hypothetical protein
VPKRFLLTTLVMSLVASAAASSPSGPDMASIAARVADKFVKKQKTRVIVTDFSGPHVFSTFTALGTKYANRFSAALAAANPAISVISREGIRASAPGYGFSSDREELSAVWEIAQATGADGVVDGEVDIHGSSVQISITTFEVPSSDVRQQSLQNGDRIDELQFEVPLEAEDQALGSHVFNTRGAELTVGLSDPVGPSGPRCLHCPFMSYVKSPVGLALTVDTKGRVIGVQVTSAPDAKTEKRIQKDARRWRFDPALDANGKPTQSEFKMVIDPSGK